MARKDSEKFRAWAPENRPKSVRMGPLGFWWPFLALLGRFLTPLGLSVGPNVYILSFWRYQTHLEPNGKCSEDPRNVILYENTYLRKTRFLTPNLALCVKWAQMATFGGSRGVQNQFFWAQNPPRTQSTTVLNKIFGGE